MAKEELLRIRVTTEDKARFEALAEEEDLPLATWLRRQLRRTLKDTDRHDAPKKKRVNK